VTLVYGRLIHEGGVTGLGGVVSSGAGGSGSVVSVVVVSVGALESSPPPYSGV
jgi:hypothetical protein